MTDSKKKLKPINKAHPDWPNYGNWYAEFDRLYDSADRTLMATDINAWREGLTPAEYQDRCQMQDQYRTESKVKHGKNSLYWSTWWTRFLELKKVQAGTIIVSRAELRSARKAWKAGQSPNDFADILQLRRQAKEAKQVKKEELKQDHLLGTKKGFKGLGDPKASQDFGHPRLEGSSSINKYTGYLGSDVCTCGHARAFHQVGQGTGVPVDQVYCDDRHGPVDDCPCKKFVPKWTTFQGRPNLNPSFVPSAAEPYTPSPSLEGSLPISTPSFSSSSPISSPIPGPPNDPLLAHEIRVMHALLDRAMVAIDINTSEAAMLLVAYVALRRNG